MKVVAIDTLSSIQKNDIMIKLCKASNKRNKNLWEHQYFTGWHKTFLQEKSKESPYRYFSDNQKNMERRKFYLKSMISVIHCHTRIRDGIVSCVILHGNIDRHSGGVIEAYIHITM